MMALTAVILGSCSKDPVPLFTIDKTEIYIGDVVSFTNQSSDADTYQWDFGDGKTSTEVNPIHSYESAGTYTVTLIASTKKNSSSYNMTLTVKRPNEFVVSNTHYPVNNVVVLCDNRTEGEKDFIIYMLNGEMYFDQNEKEFLGNGSMLEVYLYATSFETGTYRIDDNNYPVLGTCEDVVAYINYSYPNGALERGANSGYVFVSKEGNNYIIEVDCLDDSGSKITGYVETPIAIINLQE